MFEHGFVSIDLYEDIRKTCGPDYTNPAAACQVQCRSAVCVVLFLGGKDSNWGIDWYFFSVFVCMVGVLTRG